MALTKIPRGLLDTGIADSSDATAITIDSSENVTTAAALATGGNLTVNGNTNLTGNLTVDSTTLYVDSSNNRVGIGTNSPAYAFTVEKAVTDDWLSRIYNTGTAEGDNGVLIRTGSEHDGTSILSLYSGSSYKFKFQADGKLGIGTHSPTSPLHVSSAANRTLLLDYTAGSGGYSWMSFKQSGTEKFRIFGDHTAGYLSFWNETQSAHQLTLASNGTVGIGTATPGSYNANADDLVVFNDNVHAGITLAGGTNDYGNIYFAQGTSGSDAYRGYIQYGHSATTDATYRDVMLFGTATLERMRIASNGNVGIGTNSTTEVLNLYAPNNTSGGIEIAGNANTLGSTSMFVGQGSSGIGYLWQRANEYLMIATNNTERMRVDASGYVQFGATATTHVGTSQVFINRGVNASAVTSGTTQTGAALRLRGGDNAILDMGMNSVNTWIQATDRANLANLYHIALNPNGGAVSVGNYSTSDRFEVYKNTNGNFATYIAQDNPGGYGMGVRGDGGSMIYFYIGGTYQGHIYSSGGSTTYGTGSDYRLKDNVVEMSGSIDKLKKLRPVTFNFKESPTVPQQGFIAHEAQEVVPHAVAGEKDAKIDEEHQIGYQSMEYGKVTPLLTSALQEAIAKIELLETKVAALESK